MKKLLLLISFVFYTICLNAQSVTFSYDSTVFIPNGPACPPGEYSTNLVVNYFPSNAVVSSASDIMSICINIEHSSPADLGIKLICPNGQNVVLDPNMHSGSNVLGIPNDTDGVSACDPLSNPQGMGWNYCWSEIYPSNNLTLNQLGLSTGVGTVMVGNKRTIDSTNRIVHTNYILPENPFSLLVGCPINGSWNMRIMDDFGANNGYVFHWSIEFPFTIPPTPAISLIGDTLFSDAPLGNQWYNLATGAIAGATASKYHPLQTGDYFTRVSLNGQTSDSSNVIHYIFTGIETINANRFHVKVTPNPFTASTNIKYYLSEPSQVSLIIMDITGKEIQKTVSEKQAKGEQSITFTANSYPSGLFFYKLTINDSITVGKLLLNN
ncbi:MAG: T9SS type A sorting domain-containing protein [Bacteroidetes bacterium]|nr:T9SS type A sorting domain-containing protein [Bacteroidota bacterium]